MSKFKKLAVAFTGPSNSGKTTIIEKIAKIHASDLPAGSRFANSIDISGDRIIIGSTISWSSCRIRHVFYLLSIY